ncbi:hypothetical protein ACOSQ4_032993 [Xanthoceras sorbifolium]
MINRVLNDSQKEELLLISHEIGGGSEFSTRSEKELAAVSIVDVQSEIHNSKVDSFGTLNSEEFSSIQQSIQAEENEVSSPKMKRWKRLVRGKRAVDVQISESSLGKRVLFGGDEEGQDLKKLRASVDCQSNVSAVEEETYS